MTERGASVLKAQDTFEAPTQPGVTLDHGSPPHSASVGIARAGVLRSEQTRLSVCERRRSSRLPARDARAERTNQHAGK